VKWILFKVKPQPTRLRKYGVLHCTQMKTFANVGEASTVMSKYHATEILTTASAKQQYFSTILKSCSASFEFIVCRLAPL
jgi:hypothetical protein